jgi:hypothetical protein
MPSSPPSRGKSLQNGAQRDRLGKVRPHGVAKSGAWTNDRSNRKT